MDRMEWLERVAAAASTFTTEVDSVSLPNRSGALVKRWYVKLFVLGVRVEPEVLGELSGAMYWWPTRKGATGWAAGLDADAVAGLFGRDDYLNWADAGFTSGYDPVVEAIAKMEVAR